MSQREGQRERGRKRFSWLGEGQLAPRFVSHSVCAAQPGLLYAGSWLGALRTSEQVCGSGTSREPVGATEPNRVWLWVL